MAFLATDPTQDPNKKDQQQDPNAPVVLSGETAAAPVSSAGTMASNNGAKGSSSGSFTNLNAYINANKGNDAAMGSAVASNAQTKADTADQSGKTFQDTAKSAVDSSTIKDNGLVGTLKGIGGGKDSYQAGADKASGGNYVNTDDFSKEYNASYSGPKAENKGNDVSGYGETQSAYNTVDQYGKLANGNFADKGALLGDVYGKGGKQYNGGERRLDSFVLGSGQQGAQALNDISNKYGNYNDNFSNIRDAIGSYEQQGADTTAKTAKDVQDAAKGALGSIEGRFGTAADQADQATKAATDKYKALTSGDAAAWKAAGLSDAAIKLLSKNSAAFGNYVSGPSAYSAGDFANQNDVGNYSQLLGLLGAANSGLAGKYTPDQLTKTGAGPAVNKDIVSTANQAADLGSTLDSAIEAAKAKGTTDFNTDNYLLNNLHTNDQGNMILTAPAQGQIDQFAKQYGLSTQDLLDAQRLGIDPTKFLHAGNGNISYGDIGMQPQVAQFGNLLKTLGITTDLGSHGGNTTSFDTGDFSTAINNARDQHPLPALSNAPASYAPGQVAITNGAVQYTPQPGTYAPPIPEDDQATPAYPGLVNLITG